MFKTEWCIDEYFIMYINNTNVYTQDYKIVNYIQRYMLEFTLKFYHDTLKQYNAFLIEGNCYFQCKEDAERCCDYLNEKYEIIFKLLGV